MNHSKILEDTFLFQNAIHLTTVQVYHGRIKYIDCYFHFIRDVMDSKNIVVENVASEDNPSATFTK